MARLCIMIIFLFSAFTAKLGYANCDGFQELKRQYLLGNYRNAQQELERLGEDCDKQYLYFKFLLSPAYTLAEEMPFSHQQGIEALQELVSSGDLFAFTRLSRLLWFDTRYGGKSPMALFELLKKRAAANDAGYLEYLSKIVNLKHYNLETEIAEYFPKLSEYTSARIALENFHHQNDMRAAGHLAYTWYFSDEHLDAKTLAKLEKIGSQGGGRVLLFLVHYYERHKGRKDAEIYRMLLYAGHLGELIPTKRRLKYELLIPISEQNKIKSGVERAVKVLEDSDGIYTRSIKWCHKQYTNRQVAFDHCRRDAIVLHQYCNIPLFVGGMTDYYLSQAYHDCRRGFSVF